MRQIKFRYRIKIETKEIDILFFTLKEIEEGCIESFGGCEILSRDEYTGLKDKNDKEIYEGDIVAIKGFDDKEDTTYEVEMRCGCWMACNELYWDAKDENFEKFEVIGNIYSNPELLVKDKQ